MDLGYHIDQISTIFDDVGFSKSAFQVAVLGNALTDLVGNFMSALGVPPDGLGSSRLLHADNLFEHTNGFWFLLRQNIEAECKTIKQDFLAPSATEASRKAATEKLLILIGIAFHVTQDFCSHSTWVAAMDDSIDRVDGGVVQKYQRMTPLSNPDKLKDVVTGWYEYYEKWENWIEPQESLTEKTQLHDTFDEKSEKDLGKKLEKHGISLKPKVLEHLIQAVAINLDAQHRQYELEGRQCYWDEAYVCAYFTCRELLNEIQDIVGKETFDSCKTLNYAGNKLAATRSLTDQIKYLFMWLQLGHHDGHWKGPGSGDILAILAHLGLWTTVTAITPEIAIMEFYKSLIAKDSPGKLIVSFIELVSTEHLAKKLYNETEMKRAANPPGPITLPLPKQVLSLRVKEVKTFAPYWMRSYSPGISPPDDSAPTKDLDLYLKVTIEDRTDGEVVMSKRVYRERTFQNVEGHVDNQKRQIVYQIKEDLPWEVLHIFGNESGAVIKTAKLTLELFDEDTLLTGADDQIKISAEDKESYGVSFILDYVSGKLDGQPIFDTANNAPQRFPIKGYSGKWFFPPEKAEFAVSLNIAEIVG